MGIYINGIEMPKSCSDCFAEQCIGSDFGCGIIGFDDGNTTCFTRERRKDCPLIEVPPHGDLIDRNDIKDRVSWCTTVNHALIECDRAPTIIPAEQGEIDKQGCPPDYNGGFCADYDVDCKVCWEQWEQEHKAEEGE